MADNNDNNESNNNNNVDVNNHNVDTIASDADNNDEETGLGGGHTERASLMLASHGSFDSPLLISSYAIRPTGVLEEVSVRQAMASIQSSNNGALQDPLWIDVDIRGPIAAELPALTETVFDKLAVLTPFLRRHLAEPEQLQTPQVLPLSQSALIVMRVLGTNSDTETRHVAALCLPTVLVTISSSSDEAAAAADSNDDNNKKMHNKMHDAKDKKQGKMASLVVQQDTLKNMCERELPEPSVSGAAALWLHFHLGRSALATIKLRKSVYDLIDLSEDIEQIKLKQINDAKDMLLRFAAVAEEQLECVQSLEGGDAMSDGLDFTSPVLKGALAVLMSQAGSTERGIARLEKRVADLQTKYDANQQDKINHRLNVLTIISAVFLPLSLLTGFWGMNWQHGMWALESQNGFYGALGGMIILGFSLLYWFYRAGWMDR